ncbi:Fe(2+) transporter FeoB [bioreactor metagenome]|uniref:Ferrous iron transport protein B n=1 Tax=bioreactor metagenome TaxID=1076179 RepID=A0A644VDM9_9ZZZZ|nr:ferrous iron transport protein B [Acidaminococcaceae bacterium]
MITVLALVGNPNCGKTTMFNNLTGSDQYVGNWPGVTVAKKGGMLLNHPDCEVVDLPGIYSLSPYTLEEVVTRDFLVYEHPSVIINIVDASNLERNLYLTTQLLELEIPVVLALNMMDVVEANGDEIDIERLSRELKCMVVPIAAINGYGLGELINVALAVAKEKSTNQGLPIFSDTEEISVRGIERLLPDRESTQLKRWLAIKIFERDNKVIEQIKISNNLLERMNALRRRCEVAEDDDAESIVINARYRYITNTLRSCIKKKLKTGELSASDKIDSIVTNRLLAFPIFFIIMWAVYYIAIQTLGSMSVNGMEKIFGTFSDYLTQLMELGGVSLTIQSLVVNGVVGGVGAVLGFVPQITILFVFLSFLEDCGYMSRAAFIMDRAFRQFGLSGKSFIPMLVGTGCSVPGIMATRTIENEKDRRLTIMLTPFIPCSAKMPVFVLFAASLFPDKSWVGPSMYFWGIIMVVVSGIILKRTAPFAGETAPFVMEMPAYHMPGLKTVLKHTWEQVKSFILKAGTIVFAASVLVWFLQSFNTSLDLVSPTESMLANIGRFLAPVFVPQGFGNWQAAFAALTGFLAKEAIVSTFAILAGSGGDAGSKADLVLKLQSMFTPASAYAFMIFTLLAAPCCAAVGAIRSEMGSWKWTFFAVGYQTGVAYILAAIIYQVGSIIQ